jgi:hypothetical protein
MGIECDRIDIQIKNHKVMTNGHMLFFFLEDKSDSGEMGWEEKASDTRKSYNHSTQMSI